MAKSRYEYVKQFEVDDALLPSTYIVIRVDGRAFRKFTDDHQYTKPTDVRGVELMNQCAKQVFEAVPDCVFSIGASDEFSFVLRYDSKFYQRRRSKLESTVVSAFASSFVFYWSRFFPGVELRYPPVFDGRAIVYPSFKILRDYIAWRQVDFHINNLYNTTFWALVNVGNQTPAEAEQTLCGTLSDAKNEILFTRFNINYNNEPAMFRKGSIIYRGKVTVEVEDRRTGETKQRLKSAVLVTHDDVIGDAWWNEHPDVVARLPA